MGVVRGVALPWILCVRLILLADNIILMDNGVIFAFIGVGPGCSLLFIPAAGRVRLEGNGGYLHSVLSLLKCHHPMWDHNSRARSTPASDPTYS